jgi:hypothetical protein
METLATLKPPTSRLLEIQHLSSAASLPSWDQEIYLPQGGGQAQPITSPHLGSGNSPTTPCSVITNRERPSRN